MGPTILVLRSAIEEMVQEVLAHPKIETAWGLYGFVERGTGAVLVSGVIRPQASDITRELVTTELGGQHQAAAMRWLADNAALMRRSGINPASLQLRFLFKGHSHHQLGFGRYSATDHRSILEAVEVDGLPVAIGPLVTLKASEKIPDSASRKGAITVTLIHDVQIQFYYLSQEMLAAGQRTAVLADPMVIDHVDGLTAPPLCWTLTRPDELNRLLRILRAHGCTVDVIYREIHNGPPFEIQILVRRPQWHGMLSIVTDFDFPQSPPQFSLVPGSLKEVPKWTPGMDILEIIFQLEQSGEL